MELTRYTTFDFDGGNLSLAKNDQKETMIMFFQCLRGASVSLFLIGSLGCSGGDSDTIDPVVPVTPPPVVAPEPAQPAPVPPPASETGSVTVIEIDQEPSFNSPNFWPPAEFVYKGTREINQTLRSAFRNTNYTYHVYLPSQYNLEPDKHFPIIYFTDGEWHTEFIHRVIDFEERQIIAVGINHEDRRGLDYVMPGAEDYYSFLVDELIPNIESRYRVLPNERTLKGYSAGGSQSLITMFLDDQSPSIFKYYLAFDPYIYGLGNLESHIGQRDTLEMNKTLVITSMRGGFHSSVAPFIRELEQSSLNNLTVYHSVYDLEHVDATWSSFSNAMDIVYPEEN